MTKTTEQPGITKVTARFGGGEEIDVTDLLAKYIRVQDRDVAILRTAGDLAKKAGDAAAKACQRAELTAEESAALSLSGYAEEALLFLEKRDHGTVEWTTFHQDAIRTGLRLYYAECTKVREKQTALLIGTDETDEQAQEIKRVLVHVLRAPGAQLDALDRDED